MDEEPCVIIRQPLAMTNRPRVRRGRRTFLEAALAFRDSDNSSLRKSFDVVRDNGCFPARPSMGIDALCARAQPKSVLHREGMNALHLAALSGAREGSLA
jgi:hypothetical protein